MHHASFWLNREVLKDIFKLNESFGYSLYKKIISNYVNIISNKPIDVKFSENDDNKTDGNIVYISSKIDFNKFDSSIGVILHESAHVKLTDFKILKDGNFLKSMPISLLEIQKKKNIDFEKFEEFCFLIFNYVEDKFIDNHIYTKYCGYRQYYTEMYNEYFNSEVVTKLIQSEHFRDVTIDSYEFRIINLTNKNRDLTALPDLEEIYNILNLDNIHLLKTTKDRLNLAHKISKIVLSNIEFKKKEEFSILPNKNKVGGKIIEKSEEETDTEENRIKEKIDRIKNHQKDFIFGKIKKEKISSELLNNINEFDKTKIKIKEVGNFEDVPKIKCIIVDNVSKAFFEKPFTQEMCKINSEYIKKGIIQGDLLFNKVKFLPEILEEKIVNKNNGKVDLKKIYSASFNENIFYKKNIWEIKEHFVHISVDLSNSMNRNLIWQKTLLFLVSLCRLFFRLKLIHVIVSLRTTLHTKTTNRPMVIIVYDSKKDSFNKILDVFPHITPHGQTPEGLCFESLSDYINKSQNKNYFINISDGCPFFQITESKIYKNKVAAKHTKQQVSKIKNKGAEFLSYLITSDIKKDAIIEKYLFNLMYGNNSQYVDVQCLREISESLNKKFINNLLD